MSPAITTSLAVRLRRRLDVREERNRLKIGRFTAVLAAAAALVACPAAASALDGGPGGQDRWVPGELLVRFDDHVGAAERGRAATAAHVRLLGELPLVPNLWGARTSGSVRAAADALEGERGVDYAQPDYLVTDTPDASPAEAGYYPNDPYFWASKFRPTTAKSCEKDTQLNGGWPYWPLGQPLTNPEGIAWGFNPLAEADRIKKAGNYLDKASNHEIDVMPVWNLLHDLGRVPDSKPAGVSQEWTQLDLRRYGIGIMDQGISNHPDVLPNVAAEFTAINIGNAESRRETVIREIYTDNLKREDLPHVQAQLTRLAGLLRRTVAPNAVQNAERELSPLDDLGGRGMWADPTTPTGCDGHGTSVASVAGAAINNRLGVAGVGHNPPLVGLRYGMPWDAPKATQPTGATQAKEQWDTWSKSAANSVDAEIAQLAVTEALGLPVLNMSFGAQMLRIAPDVKGVEHPVLIDPALAEAFGELFSTGDTLGVASAGNDKQYYGRGVNAANADPNGDPEIDRKPLNAPCGLPLIPVLRAWEAADPRAEHPVAARPYSSLDINYRRLLLICVAGTTGNWQSPFWENTGRGSAAVQLAAPQSGSRWPRALPAPRPRRTGRQAELRSPRQWWPARRRCFGELRPRHRCRRSAAPCSTAPATSQALSARSATEALMSAARCAGSTATASSAGRWSTSRTMPSGTRTSRTTRAVATSRFSIGLATRSSSPRRSCSSKGGAWTPCSISSTLSRSTSLTPRSRATRNSGSRC